MNLNSNNTGMKKQGLEYNTERNHLSIPEYGRNIQIMIQHLLDIEDREKRTEAAKFIVNVMAQMNPQVKESNDYMHKLWDHIFIISNYKLDVDCPYAMPKPEMIQAKPEHVGYHKSSIKYGHYGQYLIDVISKVSECEEGPTKIALMTSIANQMKRDYLNWNRDTVNDALIISDLNRLSRGKLILPEGTKLLSTSEILGSKSQQAQQQQQNNKKKKSVKKVVKTVNPNRPNKKS